MNTLSIFLYLVGVSGSIQTFFIVLSIIVLVLCAVAFVFGGFMRDGLDREDIHWKEGKNLQGKSFKFTIASIFLIFFAVLIPSKETFYMIAASEIGEHIIQLEQVQDFGGEMGGLASDTITLLRNQIQQINSQIPEVKIEAPVENSNE